MTKTTMTTTAGAPIADNQNSLSAGSRGPLLLQDYQLIEKLAHQNRERIPERVVHAKGSARLWHADHHQRHHADIPRPRSSPRSASRREVFLRFSTVAGERGAADAERDVRGFALKFYTEEGNWDIVGNNTPVFFVRDPVQVPRLHPHAEAPSRHQPALADRHVGFLVAVSPRACTRSRSCSRIAACRRATASCTASARTPTRSSTRRASASG